MLSTDFVAHRDLWFQESESWQEWKGYDELKKLVVIVPHPDDEVFGCGGLLQQWSRDHREIEIIYVTGGEASHGYQAADEKAELARLRREESGLALEKLGVEVATRQLDLPDSAVEHFEDELAEQLRRRLDAHCVVAAPYLKDGHPDHNAIGRVALRLSHELGFELHFYPVWLWFWTAPRTDLKPNRFFKVSMSNEQQRRKAEAIDCFVSQIRAQPSGETVLPEEFLEHYRQTPYEVLVH